MKKFIGILCITLSYHLASSQSVGLVLSGGGAKGMAHIGVIKALEENNIPINYIAGTSAGAIVGALYASGYSVEEMTKLFESGIIESYLNPKIENHGYISKELKPTPEWLSVKFKLDSLFKIRLLPINIYSSSPMDFGFMTFFAQTTTACKSDFDKLMIPFRCVASAINENKPYVIGHGDLGAAVRASMSFPFYFSPIKLHDKVLLDGGMYNNFPVDVMYNDFKADYIIGVAVTSNFEEPDEGDLVSVLQNIFMLDVNFTMPENSVLLEPDIKNLSLLDFSDVRSAVNKGYTSCIEKMDTIKMNVKARRSNEELEYMRAEFIKKKPPLFFKNVYPNNVNDKQKQYIENLLTAKRDFLSVNELQEKYYLLTSLDNISRVHPIAVYNDTSGLYDLFLDIKQEFNYEAKIGGSIAWGGINQAYFGFQYRYFNRFSLDSKFNVYFGTFYKSLGIEAKIDYPAKILLYSYLDASLNRKNFFYTSGTFYTDASPSYLIQDEKHIQIRLGMPIFKRSEVYMKIAGVNTRDFFYNTNYFSSNDKSDLNIFTGMSLGLFYHRSTMNDYFYPDEGYSISLSSEYIFGNEFYFPGTTSIFQENKSKKHNWLTLDFNYEHFLLNKGNLSFGINARGALSSQTIWANYMSSLLHAKPFEPFQDSKIRFLPEYRTYNYGALGAKLIYKLPLNILIMAEAYAYSPFYKITEVENQLADIGPFFDKMYYIASAGIVFRNPIVPVSLNFNFYDNKDLPFTVSFTLGYTIFNSYGIE